MHKRIAPALFVLLAVLPVSVLSAEEVAFDCSSVKAADQTTPDKAQAAFANKLRHNDCLGAALCSTSWLGYTLGDDDLDLCQEMATWDKAKEREVPYGARLITEIISGLERVNASGGVGEIQTRLLSEMKQKQRDIWSSDDVGDLPISDWDMTIEMFKTDVDPGINFVNTLRSECADAARCPGALNDIAGLYSHGQLMERILSGLLDTYRQATIKYLTTIDKQWTAFRTSARAMYPWEIYINDRLYDLSEIDGFIPPPTRQFTLFHPGAGYAVSDEFDDGEQLFEAAILEIVGFYRWDGWKKDGSLKRPWGGSLVATWRNHQNDENLGFGGFLHLPRNWSVGATWRKGDEYSLLLGVDAAKWFTKDGRLQSTLKNRLFGQ